MTKKTSKRESYFNYAFFDFGFAVRIMVLIFLFYVVFFRNLYFLTPFFKYGLFLLAFLAFVFYELGDYLEWVEQEDLKDE
jgi:hypothetical protein